MEIKISLTCPVCGQTADDYPLNIDHLITCGGMACSINVGGHIFCCHRCYSDFVANIQYNFTVEKTIRRIVPQLQEIAAGLYSVKDDGTTYRNIETGTVTRINVAEQEHIDTYLDRIVRDTARNEVDKVDIQMIGIAAAESPRELTDSGELVMDLDTGLPTEVLGESPINGD